jgi:hypothetical protein
MQTLLAIGVLAGLAYLAFCLIVTRRLWKSPAYEHGQQVAQTLLIWFLPVIGLILVLAVLQAEPRRPRESDEADDDGDDDDDDDNAATPDAPDHAVASADG